MITVVSLALWCTLAAAFWWLARRVQLLLNYAEALLANAAKDRHPAGSRIEAAGDAPTDVAEFVPDPDPTTNPIPAQGPATQPAAAVIDDGWEQVEAEYRARQQQWLDDARVAFDAIEAGTK